MDPDLFIEKFELGRYLDLERFHWNETNWNEWLGNGV